MKRHISVGQAKRSLVVMQFALPCGAGRPSGTLEGMTDDPDDRVPIADVLPGLEIHPLTTGATAMEAFVLIKLLDGEGHSTWAYRTTHSLNREELLGALVVHVDVLRKELLDELE